MKKISHEEQQRNWDKEHQNPTVLHQMDSEKPSGGVVDFWETFAKEKSPKTGIEMGCGKGRNVIWLAKQGVDMIGFDFSPAAIREAQTRAEKAGIADRAHFAVRDATKMWQFPENSFDIAIDCFALTDIESEEGRANAIREFYRVLKPGGYLMAYLLSTDDAFHKEMIKKSPAHEKNAFLHNTGKFEKVFDEQEIHDLYKNFKVIEQKRVEKLATFFGKDYACRHFWLILQKP